MIKIIKNIILTLILNIKTEVYIFRYSKNIKQHKYNNLYLKIKIL